MFESNGKTEHLSRRSFLRGTAAFAAAIGVAALPAAAQQQEPEPAEKKGDAQDKTKAEPGQQPAKKKLVDKDGREYRVCDMCGGNMYKQDKTWTCEQCGYSYDE